ncbi:SMC-Scp complex subunit ScpB [uncultured Propionibacterium sp.]|uniref:SMC-Scp complex subunit ScpB n=1 Tax=uncultured Propionibacterium sp. TaxID=218066 RepID=UPI0029314C5E|nr:SMC-Scp complex subunit ScpB [uncultured Propionibacterium sp.]
MSDEEPSAPGSGEHRIAGPEGPGAERAPNAGQVRGLLEALLIMSEEPVDEMTLAEAAGAPVGVVREALDGLARFYDESGRGFQLRRVGGGWRYHTRPEHYERIAAWVRAGGQNRLTQASMETLAVIAYLQPVPRSRVSAVRGVNVDGVVRTLLARGLVDEQGADSSTGAGLLVTTDYFLARLGLDSLAQLPDIAPLLPEASVLEAELARLARPAEETGGAGAPDGGGAPPGPPGHRGSDGEERTHDEPDQRP